MATAVGAIEKLSEESAEQEVPSALLSYFLAEGHTLYKEALAQVNERETELANENEKNELVARCTAVQSATTLSGSIDEFQKLQIHIASVSGRKKQNADAYTKKQLSEVEDARCAMLKKVVELARKDLAANVKECGKTFLYAISHDGYIEMPAADGCAEKLRGALAPKTLETLLMPPALYNHQAWRSIDKQVSWTKTATLMVDVMSALLAQTTAWTVFDQEKKTVDRESLGLVGPALLILGLDSEFVDNLWQKEILNKYIELAESQISQVAEAVHHHMKNCLDRNFGSLDNAQADKVLLLLPGKTPLKQHLSQFFKVVREVGQILTVGSLSSASKITTTLSSLEQLKQNEAAFGQELSKIGAFCAGEDSADLSNFLTTC